MSPRRRDFTTWYVKRTAPPATAATRACRSGGRLRINDDASVARIMPSRRETPSPPLRSQVWVASTRNILSRVLLVLERGDATATGD